MACIRLLRLSTATYILCGHVDNVLLVLQKSFCYIESKVCLCLTRHCPQVMYVLGQ